VQECNWLQALEGGFDTSHLSFLHRGDADLKVPSRYEVIPTDYGFVAGSGRSMPGGTVTWSANVMLMPFHKLIATKPLGAHMWVPIDDQNTMNYCIEYAPDRPLRDDEMERSRTWHGIHAENFPDSDRALLNRGNDYGIDRELQRSGNSYTGIKGIGMQDCSIQESMGPIADRTLEHLGRSDTVIVRLRRLLLRTLRDLDSGAPLPGRDPRSYRVRSALFTLPAERAFEQAVDEFVRMDDVTRNAAAGT
jgi:hypothetical protein